MRGFTGEEQGRRLRGTGGIVPLKKLGIGDGDAFIPPIFRKCLANIPFTDKHERFDYFNFCLAWSKFHSVSVGENKMLESGRSSFRSLAETGFEISGKGYKVRSSNLRALKFKSPQIIKFILCRKGCLLDNSKVHQLVVS